MVLESIALLVKVTASPLREVPVFGMICEGLEALSDLISVGTLSNVGAGEGVLPGYKIPCFSRVQVLEPSVRVGNL